MRIVPAAGLAALVVLAGCVPRVDAPPPASSRPIPVPVRTPAPTPAPPPSSDWRDWAATPGTWRYAPDARGGRATFGTGSPVLTLTCDRPANAVRLTRAGVAATALTIRTSTGDRILPAQVGPSGAEATLVPTDRLLDAMGFSRGRFVVEAAGAPPLVVPAWAEVLRVVEDCRG
ncbi:hypothetical protein ACFSC3_08930 [Sphingomonas floccifaciens]|uniref:Lipoprotein n=1 Tax=Sphingomonas floccifaciens TaxID=1844115 RepID=A0ABW4NC35_9SPHN